MNCFLKLMSLSAVDLATMPDLDHLDDGGRSLDTSSRDRSRINRPSAQHFRQPA